MTKPVQIPVITPMVTSPPFLCLASLYNYPFILALTLLHIVILTILFRLFHQYCSDLAETKRPRTRPILLTLPTPKGGGFLRGTHSRELDSRRVRPKPPSHSLEIESVVTFAQNIRRAVGVGI